MKTKINQFLAITFGFSWLIWLPGVLNHFKIIQSPLPDNLLMLFGGLSPMIAALYLEWRENGKSAIAAILKRSFNFRIK